MQEIRYELLQRLQEPVDLEAALKGEPIRAGSQVGKTDRAAAPDEPPPPGLNRKQRRARARERV